MYRKYIPVIFHRLEVIVFNSPLSNFHFQKQLFGIVLFCWFFFVLLCCCCFLFVNFYMLINHLLKKKIERNSMNRKILSFLILCYVTIVFY